MALGGQLSLPRLPPFDLDHFLNSFRSRVLHMLHLPLLDVARCMLHVATGGLPQVMAPPFSSLGKKTMRSAYRAFVHSAHFWPW